MTKKSTFIQKIAIAFFLMLASQAMLAQNICDCDGTSHTPGVLTWLGDTYADDGSYTWEGQFVNFNCATWGYDCGDIVGAPADDPYAVCSGQLPPNNGCGLEILGCTDPAANNYNPDATADDGSCMYDIAGCTDPTANNYDPMATIEDGSCTYGACSNLVLLAAQTPCTPDANDVLNPSVEFTFDFSGTCTVAELIINLDGTEYPFTVDAPDNVSGSVFGLSGFPANVAFSAYYILTDGTPSDVFDFTVGDCTQDAVICDCDGNQHTIGVLSWLGDTYADNAAYTWAGVTVNFNCATWGYDCGDIAGAPAEDPYDVCGGNLPPNNGCAIVEVFGCTDPAANNYNPNATADDGSCMYDIAGCTDPTANNYDPMATIEDGSCTYGVCSNLILIAEQTPCTPDANDVLNPSVEFTFDFSGACTVAELIINLDGTEYPFTVDAPDNVSGSVFGLSGFPANVAFSAYYILTDGTPSDVFDFTVGDCTQDAVICDCDGNQHTIGVLSWLGDTYADNAAYTWAGVTVNFNCATWGYDCGDIAGAPAEDPYDVCGGNLPPNNGCGAEVFGCTDPAANNYNPDATADDGSCMYDIAGCTDPTANNYDPMATIEDGSCTYGACSNLVLLAAQTPCTPDANDVLNPSVEFTFDFSGACTVAELIINLDGTEYPFTVDAPDNVSGSVFGLSGFPANVAFSAYYILTDGTPSDVFDFTVGDCSQDAVICDCDGNQHTIGVLSWLGDTYADDAAYTWAGVPVNFNCATWGYDCGDIAGAPAKDPYDVCGGNLPPNNGCGVEVFGCTDPTANNYNPDATADDGSCLYDIAGCTDPSASNYNQSATIDDGSCIYIGCGNLILNAVQTPCQQDNAGALNPGVDFTFVLADGCTVASLVVNLDGTEYPFDVVAPDNVSGSVFALTGFPANAAFTAYYLLSDGTQSPVYEYTIGDCSQDPIICDCDGNQHTIGVLSWLGDTYADNAAYTWAGTTVNFECATWGYDCGDIVGAPAEDPYGVCAGDLPPNNGCSTTSVEEVASVMFEAYPNPTSGMLTLVNRGEGGNKQIRVFDQTGKLQLAEQRSMNAGASEQFNLSNLAAGTYHVQVVGNNGVSNITVIVQK